MSPQPKPRSSVNSEIERLLEQQKLMKQQKKDLQNELRNAQRRRKRLKHKARLLTAADLLEVMQLRQDENCQKAPKDHRGASSPRRPGRRGRRSASLSIAQCTCGGQG